MLSFEQLVVIVGAGTLGFFMGRDLALQESRGMRAPACIGPAPRATHAWAWLITEALPRDYTLVMDGVDQTPEKGSEGYAGAQRYHYRLPANAEHRVYLRWRDGTRSESVLVVLPPGEALHLHFRKRFRS